METQWKSHQFHCSWKSGRRYGERVAGAADHRSVGSAAASSRQLARSQSGRLFSTCQRRQSGSLKSAFIPGELVNTTNEEVCLSFFLKELRFISTSDTAFATGGVSVWPCKKQQKL